MIWTPCSLLQVIYLSEYNNSIEWSILNLAAINIVYREYLTKLYTYLMSVLIYTEIQGEVALLDNIYTIKL
jgi:hypothetical protein